MPAGDLNDGSRFGLPPIGFTNSSLSTEGSDTQRRQMPGLATKSSVFAWTSSQPLLAGAAAPVAITPLNLRTVVDVPTWATGCLVAFTYVVSTMGTSTYHMFRILGASSVYPGGLAVVWGDIRNAATVTTIVAQAIVPFYDEPVFSYQWQTDGTGTGAFNITLLGFIRNV